MLRTFHHDQRLTRRQVCERLDLTEGFVRDRFEEHGIATRTRGRFNREDRREVSAYDLISCYQNRELTGQPARTLARVNDRLARTSSMS